MITEFESYILALIDGMVDHISDDELFTNGYLRGHLTLTIAELESSGGHSAQTVHTAVNQGLEKVIGAGELSPCDQTLVTDMWEDLFQQVSQQQVAASGAAYLMRRSSRLIRPTRHTQVG